MGSRSYSWEMRVTFHRVPPLGSDASLLFIIFLHSPRRLQPFEQLAPEDWVNTRYWIPTPVYTWALWDQRAFR